MTRTNNHLVHKQTLKDLNKQVSLALWLSIGLRTNWMWVPVSLQSLNFQISRLLQAKSFLDIQAVTDCRFTLHAYSFVPNCKGRGEGSNKMHQGGIIKIFWNRVFFLDHSLIIIKWTWGLFWSPLRHKRVCDMIKIHS